MHSPLGSRKEIIPQYGAGFWFGTQAHPSAHIGICGGGCNTGDGPTDKQDVELFLSEALNGCQRRIVNRQRVSQLHSPPGGGGPATDGGDLNGPLIRPDRPESCRKSPFTPLTPPPQNDAKPVAVGPLLCLFTGRLFQAALAVSIETPPLSQ
jgi:hypothetical protein